MLKEVAGAKDAREAFCTGRTNTGKTIRCTLQTFIVGGVKVIEVLTERLACACKVI